MCLAEPSLLWTVLYDTASIAMVVLDFGLMTCHGLSSYEYYLLIFSSYVRYLHQAFRQETKLSSHSKTAGEKSRLARITCKKEIKIYFTASSPPLGRPTPEIDPYERHAHNWREPKAKRLEKEKKNL
jgi:hypothetical protein